MRALGMIETLGLIPSIEALDAMLKAANVEMLEKTNVRGGIVAVLIIGDVAAVKAAVDVGVAAAERVSQGTLISRHVIPRPDSQTQVLFENNKKMQNRSEIVEETNQPSEEVIVQEMETEDEETIVLHSRAEVETFLQEQGLENLMRIIKHMRNSEIKKLAKGYKAGELQVDKNVRATKVEIVNRLYDFYSKGMKE